MSRRIRSKRRIKGGRPGTKRSRSSSSSGNPRKPSVRKPPMIGTVRSKRRRTDPGHPYELAKLTRSYSSGGVHVYRTDELTSLLDKQLEQDLKDVDVDLGVHPGIDAMKSGWSFARHVLPDLDMSVVGRLTDLVGVTVASVGSVMVRLSVDKLKQASRSAAAELDEIEFMREKLQRGLELVNVGYGFINRYIPANLITMQPIDQSKIQDHNSAWENFKKNMIVLLNPAARMTDEEKRERLRLLEDMISQFDKRYGETSGSRDEQKLRFEIWTQLVTEINTLKVELKIPLHKGQIDKKKKKSTKKKKSKK